MHALKRVWMDTLIKQKHGRRQSNEQLYSHLSFLLAIGGLDDQVTSQVLHAAFIPFGEITQIEIPPDPTSSKCPRQDKEKDLVIFILICLFQPSANTINDNDRDQGQGQGKDGV